MYCIISQTYRDVVLKRARYLADGNAFPDYGTPERMLILQASQVASVNSEERRLLTPIEVELHLVGGMDVGVIQTVLRGGSELRVEL